MPSARAECAYRLEQILDYLIAKDWVVDESYREAMIAGLKVAKKQAAPDFLSVAIHAPKEVM